MISSILSNSIYATKNQKFIIHKFRMDKKNKKEGDIEMTEEISEFFEKL